MGLVSLSGMHAFRPSWKRVMQRMSDMLLRATAEEWHPCFSCGSPMHFQVAAANLEVTSSVDAAPFLIHGRCDACGDCVDTVEYPFPPLDQLIYWSHPRTRQFVLSHPKWTSMLGAEIEREGSPALSFHLTDRESSNRLTLIADRHTLRIMMIGP